MNHTIHRAPRRLTFTCLTLLLSTTLHVIVPPTATSEEPAPKKKQHTNRLADETSPYLLLHAHNPVDWYPWGDEALAKAKKEGKPIFLSVGYSSCHWCHVMERESFMDEEIAAYMNKHFVCIKVDREERPDVDSIYMISVQVITGRGGWPMSVFLTPDAKPFYGGTYFPARDGDRAGVSGFFTLLKRVDSLWKSSKERLELDADKVTELIKRQLDGGVDLEAKPLEKSLSTDVQDALAEQFDPEYGGFGFAKTNPRRPKFPEPSNLLFLIHRVRDKSLDEAERTEAKKLLTSTLDHMAMGGIRDHLGGGFHRYSVDRFWHIPHFEKMLYDNGQLASVYAEAFAITKKAEYRQVVEELLTFVSREMLDDGGSFFSALDAESEGEEGKYHVWTKKEVQELLDPTEYRLFAQVYGLDKDPNFEEHAYAPQFNEPLASTAKSLELTTAELEKQLRPIRAKLLAARDKRERPLTDTKILTAWNGLMIRGFADSGRVLGSDEYIKRASSAADFVLNELRTADERLLRTHSDGKAKLNAYLDDYAFLIDGLIGLHQATEEKKWLTAADDLMQTQIRLFGDEKRGGFYFTSNDHESLIARGRNPVDGARPSGNSISARNLIYLARATKNAKYLEIADRTIQSVAPLLSRSPSAAPVMAIALDEVIAARQ